MVHTFWLTVFLLQVVHKASALAWLVTSGEGGGGVISNMSFRIFSLQRSQERWGRLFKKKVK